MGERLTCATVISHTFVILPVLISHRDTCANFRLASRLQDDRLMTVSELVIAAGDTMPTVTSLEVLAGAGIQLLKNTRRHL